MNHDLLPLVATEYTLVYDAAEDGDFFGYIQTVGGGHIICRVDTELPPVEFTGFSVTNTNLVPISVVASFKLYAKSTLSTGSVILIESAGVSISVGGGSISEANPLPVNIVGGGNDLSVLIVEDSTGTKYIRREVIDEAGNITITYENFDGTTATPVAPITVSSTVLPVGAATSSNQVTLQGSQGTGSSYDPPTGGSGVFGWLSGLYKETVSGIKLKLSGSDVSASNPLPVLTKPESILVATRTIGAANNAVQLAVTSSYRTVSAVFTDGNISGNFEIQASFDSGATYRTVLGKRVDATTDAASSWSFNGANFVGKAYQCEIPIGATDVQLICTSYNSGSSTGKLIASSVTAGSINPVLLQTGVARLGFIAASQIHWTETIAALNSAQVFTGTWRNCMVNSQSNASSSTLSYGKQFSTSAFSDQPFDLYIEISEDQSRIRRWHKASATLVGSVYGAELTITPRALYARVVIVCGGTNMTYLDCHSNQLAN